jgi:type I restriction enzyme S subunit
MTTQTVKLGEVCEINRASIGKNYAFDSIKYLDTASVTNGVFSDPEHLDLADAPSRAKRIVKNNDIVISTVRPNLRHFGIIQNAKPNMIVSTGFAVLTMDENNADYRYIYYLLTKDEIVDYLSAVADQAVSTYPAFNPSVLENLDLTLPPLAEQRRVAGILGSLDEKIENNRRLIRTLEDLVRTLFKKHITNNEEKEGWENEPLDSNINFLNGLAMQKYPKIDGEPTLPVIKIREMSSGITNVTDIASANIPEQYIVRNGDLLFSWSGTLLVKFWTEGEGALNQHLFKVTSEKYPMWFVFFWTQYHLEKFTAIAKGKATTMGHIQRKHLHDAEIIIPDDKTLQKIDSKIEPFIMRLIDLSIENQTLAALRDKLLRKLIK